MIKTTAGKYRARAVIIASGGQSKRLGTPREEEFKGKGVAYCAMCEGSQFKHKIVAVAGGGDSGVTEALYLSKIASKVIVIEILPHLNCKLLLQKRAQENPSIQIICNSRIESILGDSHVRAIQLRNLESNTSTHLTLDGVFVHVGWEPQSTYLQGVVPLDTQGFIILKKSMETERSGVFAAGDVRQGSLKQISQAIGDGTTAAIAAQKYIRESI